MFRAYVPCRAHIHLPDVRSAILPIMASYWKKTWSLHMLALARTPLLLLVTLLLAPPVLAQSAGQLTLGEILQVAVQRAALAEQAPAGAVQYQASSWLAGLPSLTVSYLESDERNGVDEAELSLKLPIKSSERRKADKALLGLSTEMEQSSRARRDLYFSGLIRESIWSYAIADARSRFAAEKYRLLLALEERQRELLVAQATSSYSVLVLQKELIDVEIERQEYAQDAGQWLQRYRQVTGLGSMPAVIDEVALALDAQSFGRHPQLLAMQSAYEQQRQLLLASSDRSADWNVSINAKNLSSGSYDEDQYGVAVEMPFSFIDMQSQSGNNELAGATRQYHLAREELTQQLYGRWQQLAGQSRTLREKQALLLRANDISLQIEEQLSGLQASSEISQDVALRRKLDAIDTRTALHINQLNINQNNAMLRQAAGLPL